MKKKAAFPVVEPVVKKATKPARQMESVSRLYEKLVVATENIGNKAWVDEADHEAKVIVDRGDSHTDRLDMLYLMLDAREYARFEKRMALEVNPAWAEAQKAWVDWVEAENAKGHQGKLAMEKAFTKTFIEMSGRIATSRLWQEGPDAVHGVIADLESLTFEVTNFNQKWCHCGEPIPDDWKVCRVHYVRKPAASNTPPELPKRKVKKPGSAQRRHTDGSTGGKGRPSADGTNKRAKKAEKAAAHGEG